MFSYLSILNPGFTTVSNPNPLQVGTLAYVSFLNPPGTGAGGGAAISAGTNSTNAGTVVFSNSNGLSFGMNTAGVVTGSHDGVTTTAQAFKTLSAGSGSFTGNVLNVAIYTTSTPWDGLYVQAQAGTLFIGNSSGFRRISAGEAGTGTYVETTYLSIANANGIGFGIAGATLTARAYGTASMGSNTVATQSGTYNASNLQFGGAGVASVGYSNGSVIVSVPAGGGAGDGGNVLAASGSTASSTGTVYFVNSNGVSFGLNGTQMTASHNALTTAMASNEPHIQGIIYSNATQTNGSLVLSGSNGITVRSGAGTAIIEFDGHHMDAVIPSGNGYGTGFSSMTSGTVGLNFVGALSGSQNGNSLSLSVPAQTVQPAVGLNTAATSVTWTVNSSGISLNAGAYLTTAAQVSHSHGNPTLALTNLTGTTASASNGLTISLSAAAPGGGAAQTFSAGTTSQAPNPILFSNQNGVTFGMGTGASSSVMTASINPGAFSVGNYWAVPPWGQGSQSNALLTNITGISRRFMFYPFQVQGTLSCGELHWPMSRSTNGSNSFSVYLALYSYSNSSRIDTFWSTSVGYSATATASVSGLRGFEATFASISLTPGQYVLGMMFDPVGGSTSAMNYSLMGAATGNSMLQTQVVNGSDTYHNNVNHMWLPFHGRFSVTSAAVPASVPAASILAQGNATNVPLPMYWVLGTHYA